MKKRHMLGVEALEARETPDVSLGSAAACPPPAGPAGLVAVGQDPGVLPDLTDEQQLGMGAAGAPSAGEVALANDLLLAWQDNPEKAALSLQALKALFSNSSELEALLAGSTELAPESGQALVPAAGAEPSATEGWQFLFNYSRKALRNAELKYGTLPDHEDLLHDIFVDWRQQVGTGDQVFARLLNPDSTERQVLRKAVRRVIDHARYEQTRQGRMMELVDQPAPANPAEQDWTDLQIDWSLGVANPGPRQRQLLELRRQGLTFEEIGAELGMLKQRVCEVYNAAVQRLQEIYAGSVG